MWSGDLVASEDSMILLMMWIGCEQDLLDLNPYWVFRSWESIAFAILVWRILAKSLYAVLSRLIGL